MYKIFADKQCLYNDSFITTDTAVIDPKLTIEANSAGSFELALPITNKLYNKIEKMQTIISVEQNTHIIWTGRVLSEKIDFYKKKTLTCEGALTFLNDSIQPLKEYKNIKTNDYIVALIEQHNSCVTEDRQFAVGNIDAYEDEEPYTIATNFKTTKSYLDDIRNNYGGYFIITYPSNKMTINYYIDYPRINKQTINFGKNLLDFTQDYNLSELCTVLIPLGKALDEVEVENETSKLTVASVNDGKYEIESPEAVELYGRIAKVVEWSDVDDPNVLLELGKRYLSESQFDSMSLTINAIDAIYLNSSEQAIQLLDLIRVVSVPHGMDTYFPVTKIELMLANPESTKYTLNYEQKTSFTSNYVNTTNELAKNKGTSSGSTSKSYISKVERVSDTHYLITATKGLGSSTSVTNDWTVDNTATGSVWTNSLNGQKITFTGW